MGAAQSSSLASLKSNRQVLERDNQYKKFEKNVNNRQFSDYDDEFDSQIYDQDFDEFFHGHKKKGGQQFFDDQVPDDGSNDENRGLLKKDINIAKIAGDDSVHQVDKSSVQSIKIGDLGDGSLKGSVQGLNVDRASVGHKSVVR